MIRLSLIHIFMPVSVVSSTKIVRNRDFPIILWGKSPPDEKSLPYPVSYTHLDVYKRQILGNPASELIVIAGIAIQRGYTVEEFQKTVFPHPTVGELSLIHI